MRTFRLPDLGEGLQEAEIVEWHVREGDTVKADDPLVAVETEKAVTEIPAPWSGRIARLHAPVGGLAKVGAPIVDYEGEGQPATPRPADRSGRAPIRPATPAPRSPIPSAMPAVRLLARELGLDPASIAGTGPGGAVLVKDVASAFRAAVAEGDERHEPARQPAADSGYEALTGPRRAMARNMARSRDEVVPATVHEEASTAAWASETDVTVRLIRAILAGVGREPVFNSWFDAARGLNRQASVNLGIAVDIEDGLVVPVLKQAQDRDPAALRAELDRLIAEARARTLSREDLAGATITLSNYGMIAGLHATPVVIPPQVAILGAGRRMRRVVARDGGTAVEPLLPLSLTYDHRAITGGEAARFVKAVVADIESAE